MLGIFDFEFIYEAAFSHWRLIDVRSMSITSIVVSIFGTAVVNVVAPGLWFFGFYTVRIDFSSFLKCN